ncbi:MAG: hypothetical protein HKN09_04760 [Saprospiraceae bacterium]|nr:hypothetical protein [Saprospiraceae bacterium]
MKKTLNFLFAILALSFIACSDPCDDVNCNNGTCDDGTCICDAGYDGALCDAEIRAQYYGTFEGNLAPCLEALGGGMIDTTMLSDFLTGTLVVSPGPTIMEINLASASAFANFNQDVNIDSPTFNIPETVTEFEDPTGSGFELNITASGIGVIQDENNISMNLIISISIPIIPIPITSNCEIIFTKV